MLLGASSEALDTEVDLRGVTGETDAGVARSAELGAFAEAAWRRDDSLATAREMLRRAVGDAGLVEAAATVAIFRSLNIAADSSGIPLDDDFADHGLAIASDVGFDRFATAANTPGARR